VSVRGKWKSAVRLRAGEVEQYAVIRGGVPIVVELSHRPARGYSWQVTEKIASQSHTSVWQYVTLDAARRRFKELVRKHP
jgi:hypothetical protein